MNALADQVVSSAQELTSVLDGNWNGTNGSARCPAHDDASPSLSITDGSDKILVKCHAGCDYADIKTALADQGIRMYRVKINTSSEHSDLLKKLIDERRYCCRPQGTPVETYLRNRGLRAPKSVYYTKDDFENSCLAVFIKNSVTGKPCGFQTTPLRTDGSDRRRDLKRHFLKGSRVNGAYVSFGPTKTKSGKQRKTLFIAEGIETGLTIREITRGYVWSALSATNLPNLSIPAQFKKVYICADNDEAGLKGAHALADKLAIQGRKVAISAPPKSGTDWNDVWRDGLKKQIDPDKLRIALADRIKRAGFIVSETELPVHNDLFVSGTDVIKSRFPEMKKFFGEWLSESSLTLVHARSGLGKTYFALGIAHAVSNGEQFLEWKSDKPRPVYYVDAEMPVQLLQKRLQQFASMYKTCSLIRVCSNSLLHLQGSKPLSLLEEEDRQEIYDNVTEKGSVLVLDNLSSLAPSAENDQDLWEPINSWLLALRNKGISVILVHHDGKNLVAGQRGLSRKTDQFDNVIHLTGVNEKEGVTGLTFDLKFSKARDSFGSAIAPFRARMECFADEMSWEKVSNRAVDRNTQIIERYQQLPKGVKSMQLVAEEFGVHKSTVSRILKRSVASNAKTLLQGRETRA